MTDQLHLPLGCTCFKLRKLTRAMSRLYDQHLATVGLKSTQYVLLNFVAAEAMPVALLAERFGAERTTMTRNLKPLIEAGWVTLEAGADSRQRIVTISAAGRAKTALAYDAWRAAQDAVEALLGAAGVAALHRQIDSTYLQLSHLTEDVRHADPD
ncbi:MarR family winged helix-turn-helix transcriptional regulator [Massilia sp. DWR3-1-1]|uniref:MarR family winged helix-turn-helix transcriptional regulator n=1 Tax=Massilia sp. DWR3-1-1 TaxID=2804559 RepID=UPI003CF694E7